MLSGAYNLSNKQNLINALNVFPVPDGDTGSNMASTILSAEKVELNNDYSIANVSSKIAQGLLFSARGNSGVILSQIFKGFSVAFQNKNEINSYDLVKGFEEAAKFAYKAVLKPIEGTILTVIRQTAEGLKENILIDSNITEVAKVAVELARKSCDNTPNLLPVLKEVEVTDSGGEGLYAILEGILAYFEGQPVTLLDKQAEVNKFISDTEVFDGEFGYCTEFIVELKNKKKFNKETLISKLERHGGSMVVVQDESFLKVHIHAVRPGDVLNTVNNLGQFIKVKIENMTLQANDSKKNSDNHKKEEECCDNNSECTPMKKSAIISCNSGSGIIELLKENGVAYIVEGGQTNNPSINDIVSAINSVKAETIFIFPNNKNIILSAQQASTIVQDKKIIVVPTKSQAQTLSVLYNYSEENSVADNQQLMNDALLNIHYGEVSPSIKTTKLNGIKVKAGDFMAIQEGKLKDTDSTFNRAAIKLLHNLINSETQIVTIFYGQDVTEADVNELQNYIEINFNVSVEIYNGGQNIYPYLISAE
ncbi:DAK2 domain fusion protein YloV [Mycoplasmopsis arginini]|nr:DAK2 domain fusion protein YloV [Chlamydia abortus]SGA16781.1 DAK2 domain fusion protein YloV [Mycoplasmopsis arginini]SGA21664.1 DAK2 domain fusion protein YloV [Mycoplasmopsis arginini]SGA32864.1 DAK2 domain fusion protein YloV [Chlamydia abortus]